MSQQLKIMIYIIAFLNSCGMLTYKYDKNENWMFLSLILWNKVNDLSRNNIFVNHSYSFSIKRDKSINSKQFHQCIDIYKLKSLDANKVITSYDKFEKVAQCGSSDILYIRCINQATTYVEVQNFINDGSGDIDSNFTNISQDCKNIENGIIAY